MKGFDSLDLSIIFFLSYLDFDLVDDDTCRAVLRMFMQCNLVSQFHIPYEVSLLSKLWYIMLNLSYLRSSVAGC